MKIFKDAELKEEVQLLDLGRVEAGESKEYTFYVLNTTDIVADRSPVDSLEFSTDNKEIEFTSFPEELLEDESAKIVLTWKPSIDLKAGLKTFLKIKGKRVYE